MVCTSCGQTSLMGRTVQGRNTPGYDYQMQQEQYIPQQQGQYVFGEQGLPSQPKLGFDLGTLVAGVVIGGVLGYFLFASSGRRIGSAAAGRVERRIRG